MSKKEQRNMSIEALGGTMVVARLNTSSESLLVGHECLLVRNVHVLHDV